MDLDPALLQRFEWVSRAAPGARLFFRRDGTGWYEREALAGARPVHENLLWRADGAVLHLKFARARGWTQVGAALQPGDAADGARVGRHRLVLAEDPYARAVEERPGTELTLLSDEGAALPS